MPESERYHRPLLQVRVGVQTIYCAPILLTCGISCAKSDVETPQATPAKKAKATSSSSAAAGTGESVTALVSHAGSRLADRHCCCIRLNLDHPVSIQLSRSRICAPATLALRTVGLIPQARKFRAPKIDVLAPDSPKRDSEKPARQLPPSKYSNELSVSTSC